VTGRHELKDTTAMKLTITIEEEKESEVRIERPGSGAALGPAEEEHLTEPAAMNAGGPPESLLSELEQGSPAQAASETGYAIDAGPAPASTNGMAALRT
jgi:hypothetical protein